MRKMIGITLAVVLFVAACGDDDGSLDSCEAVVDAGIDMVQDMLDTIDGMTPEEIATQWGSGETPEELQAVQEAGEALDARAAELGCSEEEMNALVAERVDRLSADSEFGRMIVEAIRGGEESLFEG
jgi:hypothetical protein